jgi:hypothetical protein
VRDGGNGLRSGQHRSGCLRTGRRRLSLSLIPSLCVPLKLLAEGILEKKERKGISQSVQGKSDVYQRFQGTHQSLPVRSRACKPFRNKMHSWALGWWKDNCREVSACFFFIKLLYKSGKWL